MPVHLRWVSRLLTLAALLAPAAVSAAALEMADSTMFESWALPNGLKVVTRHVPRATAIAIDLCYRVGSTIDPAGREGLASLLAELAFTAATADAPERTREEMPGLRPLGWNLRITPSAAHLVEIASVEHLPGVLHQVASRMRGVRVDDASLRASTATVQRDLAANYAGNPERALYYLGRGLAHGQSSTTLQRYATGRSLQGLAVKEAQQRLSALYVPANAVLSIAGNLSPYDLRRLVESEFGGIAGGVPLEPTTWPALQAGDYRLPLAGLDRPVGGLVVLGPALTDSLHPTFSLHALLIGAFCRGRMGPPNPPLATRFEYSLLDEPDLARFYIDVSRNPADSVPVLDEFHYTLSEIPIMAIERKSYLEVVQSVDWLLGGPLPPAISLRMRSEPGALFTLASGMAMREHWGGEAFWTKYRERFRDADGPEIAYWRDYFGKPKHLVQLRLVPEKGTAAKR